MNGSPSLRRAFLRLSVFGLLLGALSFAAALTPSLIPRSYPVQGVLCGTAFALGYGIGVAFMAVWRFLQIPEFIGRRRQVAVVAGSVAAAVAIALSLARLPRWQDGLRGLFGLPPLDQADRLYMTLIALVVATVLILLGKVIRWLYGFVERRLQARIPPRVAAILGVIIVALLTVTVANRVVLRNLLQAVDKSYEALDAMMEPDVERPFDPMKPGNPASLIDWKSLGRTGRAFVTNGLDAAGIAELAGGPAQDPIRVYAGLNSAQTPRERADLALAELQRVGGFDRSVMVIAVPTGTGWMDPAALDTLEVLHRGDVATVAIQYSYLQSWISLLVQPEFSLEAGRALFEAVYDYWRNLPADSRPRLYLYGISLGSYSSQESVRLYEMLGDPVNGALWVGPPFVSPLWQSLTRERNPGTTAWRPEFEDGAFVRFTNFGAPEEISGPDWGPMRVVYLQHPSDPIVFFEPRSFYEAPAWMTPPRGEDVSPVFRWFPGVTFLQLLLDMALGLSVPAGHGHLYSHADHVWPWVAVTQPEGWTADALNRLGEQLAPRLAK